MLPTEESLPNDFAVLKRSVIFYATENGFLREMLRLANLKLYGRKSEQFSMGSLVEQLALIDEALPLQEVAAENMAEIDIPAHTRRKSGRKPMPESLPRVDQVYDISEEEKVCGCGAVKSRIGQETSEQLDVIPAKAQVVRQIRFKYACKDCEGVLDAGPTIAIAPAPPQIIPKSIATPGLLAHVLTAKFVDSMPFYRQQKQFARMGVDIMRATMCGWAIKVAEACEPVMKELRDDIHSGPAMSTDDTGVQVLDEPGRDATTKSSMSVFRGGQPGQPAVEFVYTESCTSKFVADYLQDYMGSVQTDGGSAYVFLDTRPGIRHGGCLTHARRKFANIVKLAGPSCAENGDGVAQEAVKRIRELYKIEAIAREKKLSPDEIRELRQELAKPRMESFHAWLLQRKPETPPKSLLGKAISYTLGQWHRLIQYLEDGHLQIDNNLTENAIRPFAVGRKNWLFCATPEGAKASATLYSLIETAKANGLEPYWYLRYLFERLPLARTAEDFKALLPQHIDKKVFAEARDKCLRASTSSGGSG